MRTVDLIHRKRDGEELDANEISYLIDSYTRGEIPDYQMSAFLMAVCFSGMTDREVSVLTERMTNSGELVDLSAVSGLKVDKHSTGGVGDKTSLIAAVGVLSNSHRRRKEKTLPAAPVSHVAEISKRRYRKL